MRFQIGQDLETVIGQQFGLTLGGEDDFGIASQNVGQRARRLLDAACGPIAVIGGFLRCAPSPEGGVFPRFGGAKLSLGFFDLSIAASVCSQLHVGPDRTHQFGYGAFVDDFLAVAIYQAARIDIDPHCLPSGADLLDPQVIGAAAIAIVDFANVDIARRKQGKHVIRRDAGIKQDVIAAARKADATLCTDQGDGAALDQMSAALRADDAANVVAVGGVIGPVIGQNDRSAIIARGRSDAADAHGAGILANVDAGDSAGIQPVSDRRGAVCWGADGDRQGCAVGADAPTCAEGDLAPHDIGLGLAAAGWRFRIDRGFRRDVALRCQRDRAQSVGDTTINDQISAFGVDHDLTLIVPQKVDVDGVVGLYRVGVGNEFTHVTVVLIGKGLLSIPAFLDVVIGLLPVGGRGDHLIIAVGIGVVHL